LRRNVVAVGAAIGLTLGGLGVAAAQTDSSTTAAPAAPAPPPGKPGHRGGPGKAGVGLATAAKAIGSSEADLKTALGNGQSVSQVAQAKGVDPAKVISALVDEAKAKLAEEVKAGRITQAQADERSADLQARVTEHVNRTGKPGKGGRGKGGPGRKGHGPGLAAAAKAIGISEADLLTELRAGKSIAQVAQAKGVEPAKVITAIVDEAKAKMAERAATLQERVTEQVNRVGGAGADRPGP
jgi:ribosomal protein S13